jgi:hypothetical protein
MRVASSIARGWNTWKNVRAVKEIQPLEYCKICRVGGSERWERVCGRGSVEAGWMDRSRLSVAER